MIPEVIEIKNNQEDLRKQNKILIDKLIEIQEVCKHKIRQVVKRTLQSDSIYCGDCNKLLGYKCDNREDSPCSYNLKSFNYYHAKCRHNCGRIYEDDCQ